MSAYGTISLKQPRMSILPPTVWKTQTGAPVTAFHLNKAIPSTSTTTLSGLLTYLHAEFAKEVEAGRTYPQESDVEGGFMTYDAFIAYFFAADLVVGLIGGGEEGANGGEEMCGDSIEQVLGGRDWSECVAGFYYVKPNYPGRSSHICNAGFVTPVSQRGKGYATALARSFLHYAPRLGYEASVFNLVYVNNTASVKIWENLDFTKVGLIPRAGRLRTKDGGKEEYVDAWVFYKRFDPVISQ